MGFLDGLFGGDKPNQKNIDKLVVRVKERYAQPEYRREAMTKLLEWNTPESIYAVLSRFTVVAQSPHWDEEEKRWLVDELADKGAPAREALKKFLGKENHVAFAARALSKMGTKDEYISDLMAALKARAPDDYRSTQGKTELVASLAETEDARVLEALLPYVDDHGDDVQCAVVDALGRLWPKLGDTGAVTTKLQAVITDDARSARVLRHTAAAMQRLALPIDATKPLAPAVAEDFLVKDGKLAPAHAQ
jgi:hypothetical protein